MSPNLVFLIAGWLAVMVTILVVVARTPRMQQLLWKMLEDGKPQEPAPSTTETETP